MHSSNESGGPNGVSTLAGQTGLRWPSALADKLKFDYAAGAVSAGFVSGGVVAAGVFSGAFLNPCTAPPAEVSVISPPIT